MFTIIIFVLILSTLVIAHEFGHFITARKSGMRVYEFGLGFPPRAFGFFKDPKTGKWVFVKGKGKSSLKETVGGEGAEEEFPNTLYSLNWLPLGGFVKIKGENGEAPNDKDSFGNQKAWKRFVVVVAGVTMNVLLAGVLLGVGYMIGIPTDITDGVDGKAVLKDEMVLIQQVSEGSPASLAGVKSGDQVLSLNGESILTSDQFLNFVRTNSNIEMTLAVERDSKMMEFVLTPTLLDSQEDDIPRLGVMMSDTAILSYPWYIAIYKGFVSAFYGFAVIFGLFITVIKNLIMGQGLAYEVSGPVGIASMVGQSARMGINYLISTAAMLSITLAVINILPFPALDGGRAFFIIIEKIIKRPVPIKYEQLAHTLGFVLLMLLVVIVTVKDIWKIFV
ncbi:MAG: RIP metalloprotease RseP [Candidatus Magasanikbacteria bacterium RIFCSPHIGHO2_01_FULL_33_34]|uniref:Zinc metalloprotease n=1 Tax=Candidatus Magasanikbacteria bacterium RIFCSPHIGHO2_01_FULL_33_34 TaxID=1798671 RepID=A0A1F6LKX8_9BACT|nr:MAG: RIP metalloprotease RseP [Candidatus Magasanikbacteria bacterium RIFCSPHIGHO2_01_FULL_33_34]OGH65709.1 MAG: RIP metalloprotease RseP [Candidatus Magasanikbacteria bacterium RIFCSPHIGHO2_02_FULL_33_17]OGH76322.1 MAG: RIP metalloprotease RseP [Candidatus Magasanikbacteria bacterium RIFCSPLOWO2_01_FULL_33_34]